MGWANWPARAPFQLGEIGPPRARELLRRKEDRDRFTAQPMLPLSRLGDHLPARSPAKLCMHSAKGASRVTTTQPVRPRRLHLEQTPLDDRAAPSEWYAPEPKGEGSSAAASVSRQRSKYRIGRARCTCAEGGAGAGAAAGQRQRVGRLLASSAVLVKQVNPEARALVFLARTHEKEKEKGAEKVSTSGGVDSEARRQVINGGHMRKQALLDTTHMDMGDTRTYSTELYAESHRQRSAIGPAPVSCTRVMLTRAYPRPHLITNGPRSVLFRDSSRPPDATGGRR